MSELVGSLPRHLYVWVDSRFTHKLYIESWMRDRTQVRGFLPAIWFGLVSYPCRMWGCNVMFESGAVYRNVPPHAIAFKPDATRDWSPQDSETWDCYGTGFSCLEYSYLSGLRCKVRANGNEFMGRYLFTAAPIGDGFSVYPEQAKEFTFAELDNGRLSIQPTNFVLFQERSFTRNDELEFPTDIKRQTEVWRCE